MRSKCSDDIYYRSNDLVKDRYDLMERINVFYSKRKDLQRDIETDKEKTKKYKISAEHEEILTIWDEMVKELMRKGYQDAEKAVFDLSQYYTVVAGRYITRTAASGASGELKRAGIDNYVIKKK